MKRIFTVIVFALITTITTSQIVINELDSDTEGADFAEFIELKSDTPNFPLDGYVVVLFNGSASGNDSSYFALDLDGFTTDINGLLLIGSTGVSPIPSLLIPSSTIQNGADAVAIYLGNATDWPEFTRATTTNLIDALLYDTSDPDDTGLMTLLGITVQTNEDEGGNGTINSVQRNNDGTYFVGTPTPGVLNDGTGFDFNGISFTTDEVQYLEGQIMTINFTTEFNTTSNLNVNFTLENGTFGTNDYSGNTMFTIPAGSNSASVQIQLLTDGINDGDEFAKIHIGEIPSEYNLIINDVLVLVEDLDFTMANFGTPLNPTFGIVQSTAPAGYYASLTGLSGSALRQELQNIITSDNVRAQTYNDAIDILKEGDQNPLNSNEVWLMYTEQPRKKILYQSMGGSSVGLWNREHTYPRSRGGFFTIEYDEVVDGRDIFVTTSPDSLRHGISDGHGLRATDGPENSSRNNKDYGEYSGPAGNLGSWKGDAARAVMFMAIRYNNVDLVEGNPDNGTLGQLGDLVTLLQWHNEDPADDYEMNRNNVVYTWQFNRNPFIDRPDLVDYIYGSLQDVAYDPSLNIESNTISDIKIFPNPSNGQLNVMGINTNTEVTVYSLVGKKVDNFFINGNQSIQLALPSGIYTLVFKNDTFTTFKKLLIR